LLLRVALFGKLAPVLQRPRFTWAQSVYSGFALVFDYTRLLLWPAHLSAFHAFHPHSRIADAQVLAGIAIVAFCLLLLAILARRAPEAAISLWWAGVMLAPVLNARWMASNVLTERYLYLPSVGFCWLIAWAAVKFWDALDAQRFRAHFVRVPGVLVVLIILMAGTAKIIARNRDWSNDFVLYSRTLESDPDAHIIRHNLAGIYYQHGDVNRAAQEWELVLLRKPDNVVTMNSLGIVYTEQGRYSEAASMFQHAMDAKPLFADPHFNYGMLLRKTGQKSRALEEFNKAVELAPLNPVAHQLYAEELCAQGRYRDAQEHYNIALSLEPDPVLDTYKGLVTAYLGEKQTAPAEGTLRKILARFPYDSTSHFQLALILENRGSKTEARQEYRAGLALEPNNSEAIEALKRLR
jgi:Tfp pilus assembly protein PilF